MRFTDNASITSANMANDDILAGTDVSASADKKFSLANIADWLLNKFNGLSLAGSQQTVKSALDSLNSNITNLSSGTILDYVKSQVAAGVPEGHFLATSAVTDIPASGNWFVSYVRNTGSNIVQVKATQYNDSRVIYNTHIGNYQSSTAFAREWTQEPTRAEMDAVASKIKYVSKTITVPAGSSSSPSMVDIDFSEDVVSGAIYGLFASAGATPIPYVNNNGQVQTWIRSVGAKTARIYETGTGYSSRDWYFVLFIK